MSKPTKFEPGQQVVLRKDRRGDVDLRIAGPNSPAVARAKDKLAFSLAMGMTPDEILDKVAGENPGKRQKWRMRMIRWATDEDFQQIVGMYLKAEQVLWSGSLVRALHRRGSKGNIPAIKLAMEASGFHNPRVQHDHSGEISITIKGLPRPEVTTDSTAVEDATVVEG